MKLILLDIDASALRNFDPVGLSRPLFELRTGITNLAEKLIAKTKPEVKGLILVAPYLIESNLNDPMRVRMEEYANVIKTLAEKHGAVLVDTQAGFDGMLETMHPMALAWDRIHPNTSGHALLTKVFLKAIGFELT